MPDPRDEARLEPGSQLIDPQQVQYIVPGQSLQHAQKDAFRIEVPDLAAVADHYLVQLVRIDGVIPCGVNPSQRVYGTDSCREPTRYQSTRRVRIITRPRITKRPTEPMSSA